MKLAWVLIAVAACTPTLEAEGPHHRYVIASIAMPKGSGDAPTFAVDLDGSGRRLNAFGAGFAGFLPIAITTNAAISRGDESLLVDLQATRLDTAAAAGIAIQFGEVVAPPACIAPDSCGHHLNGDAQFGALSSPTPEPVFGTVRGGAFISDPGPLTIQLSFDGFGTIDIPLLTGRVQLGQLSDKRIGQGVIGGAISRDFVINSLMPLVESALSAPLGNDCNFGPQGCTCLPGSPGEVIDVAFDVDRDCVVTGPEFASSPAVMAASRSDLLVGGAPAVSFGMGITAVGASF